MNTTQYILITGGAGGLGRAACRAFLAKGYSVFSLDKHVPQEPLSGVTDIACDLTREEEVERALFAVKNTTDSLSCVLHLAGIYHMDAFSEMKDTVWQKITEVNVLSVARVNRLFLPLILNGQGRILITTSELATGRLLPFNGVYAASKAALKAYTDALRAELNLLDVPVIEIRPGAFATPLLADANRAMEEMCAASRYFAHSGTVFRRVMDTQMDTAKDPQKLCRTFCRAATARHPRLVYRKNNNFLLALYGILPTRLANFAVKKLLKR